MQYDSTSDSEKLILDKKNSDTEHKASETREITCMLSMMNEILHELKKLRSSDNSTSELAKMQEKISGRKPTAEALPKIPLATGNVNVRFGGEESRTEFRPEISDARHEERDDRISRSTKKYTR